jgi:alkylated DNA repair dioxygenase AlkB
LAPVFYVTLHVVLFGLAVPPGFRYIAGLISPDEEHQLVAAIQQLDFSEVVMRGVVAKRRTAHFGYTYGYGGRTAEPGAPIPDFLIPVRARVAAWSHLPADTFVEALVTEYRPGAAIGWHRDAPMFEDVIGISLLAACRMKLRPYVSPKDLDSGGGRPRRTTHEIELEPRSCYLISQEARTAYEHHIPAVVALRYSITFRSLRPR